SSFRCQPGAGQDMARQHHSPFSTLHSPLNRIASGYALAMTKRRCASHSLSAGRVGWGVRINATNPRHFPAQSALLRFTP
ncbi:MAG: hypothetical protein LBF81_04985, partial [Prevotellaceae bacterium]|nr:hypothetical protein [Prevotellaceae bacterium]